MADVSLAAADGAVAGRKLSTALDSELELRRAIALLRARYGRRWRRHAPVADCVAEAVADELVEETAGDTEVSRYLRVNIGLLHRMTDLLQVYSDDPSRYSPKSCVALIVCQV
jgi:hypothetical protein